MYINVDVDNLWIYEQDFGVSPSNHHDLMFEESLPRMLELFSKFKAQATFFVVGRDLERQSCREFCAEAVRNGHEIANHSYSHFGNLKGLSFKEKEAEVMKCHELIAKCTGIEPVGFRGPGYYFDREIAEVLMREGYVYDSSILPGVATFLMTLKMLISSGRSSDKVCGRKRWVLASRNLTRIESRQHPGKFLIELPVATAPYIRWPIHTTYIYMFGMGYFNRFRSWLAQQAHGVYLVHGIDTMEYPEVGQLASKFLPFAKTLEERMAVLSGVLTGFSEGEYLTTRDGLASVDLQSIPRSFLI